MEALSHKKEWYRLEDEAILALEKGPLEYEKAKEKAYSYFKKHEAQIVDQW